MSKHKQSIVMNSNPQQLKILKFRSFASKEQQGFIFIFDHQIPQIIFEDLLFQIFQPIFQELYCPEIYYFSSTDQSLSYNQMIRMKDYIYVHFLQRVQQYERLEKYSRKLKIGNIHQLSKGIHFDKVNLYIVSQKYYLMYGHEFFYRNIQKKIDNLPLQIERKEIKYDEYCKQVINLRDNHEMIQLKNDLVKMVNDRHDKFKKIQDVHNRYIIASKTIRNILKQSGIKILGIKDLY